MLSLFHALRRTAPWGLTPRVGLALLVGGVGLIVVRALKVPGGAFMGAMLATACLRLAEAPLDEPPAWLRSLMRILIGLTIGATVTQDTLRVVLGALLPVVVVIVAMVAIGVGVAWVISRLTGMDLPTALCGSTPGALAAMVSLAEDLGGDTRVVASMQLVRLLSILLLVPPLVHAAFAHGVAAVAAAPATATANNALWALLALLLLGLVAGRLAVRARVPSGDLLAPLVVAAVLNPLWLHLAAVPNSWQIVAQWVIGAGVGATVNRAALRAFRPFAVAGGVMTALLILTGLGLGWVLAQITSLDLATAIVGSTPGGADQMILLAGDLGANVPLVAAMHVSRQVLLILLLPLLTRIAAGRAGTRAAVPVGSAGGSPTAG
ncbi:MAG: AbrB family transcriptional regulator [Anaerolineae bacterium]